MSLPNTQTVLTRATSGVLYSTVLVTAAAGTLSNQSFLFFSYGWGQPPTGYPAGTVASYCETNFRGQGGQMPAQKAFVADGIAINYSNYSSKAPIPAADLHNLYDNGTVISWYYQDVDTIMIAPTAQIPAGAGPQGVAGTNGGVASEVSMGPGIFRFPQPVPINPLQTFGLQLKFPLVATTPTVSIAIRCTLYGVDKTAVASG